MPFCPQCSYEYPGDALVCPECGVVLVDHLAKTISPAATKPDDSWIGICRVGGLMSSQMIRGLLDSNNIPSIEMSSAFQALDRSVNWPGPSENDAVDNEIVMVPREFHQEAELLLAAILGEDFEMLELPKP